MMMAIIPSYRVEAKTLKNLKDELATLEAKYAEASKNKNLTDAEIKSLSNEINNITSNIETIKSNIKKAEEDIQKSEKEITEKKKETDELLKFLQVSSGENVYLEYIFEADSYTDFIYRYSIVSQLTEYNTNLMEELETLVKTLEEKKVSYNNEKASLEKKSNDLNSKIAVLQVNLENYKQEGSSIEQDIEDMKKQIEIYENRGCKDNEDITVDIEEVEDNQEIAIAKMNASAGIKQVKLNLNGTDYPIELDGNPTSDSLEIPLSSGNNKITVTVIDMNDKEKEEVKEITR